MARYPASDVAGRERPRLAAAACTVGRSNVRVALSIFGPRRGHAPRNFRKDARRRLSLAPVSFPPPLPPTGTMTATASLPANRRESFRRAAPRRSVPFRASAPFTIFACRECDRQCRPLPRFRLHRAASGPQTRHVGFKRFALTTPFFPTFSFADFRSDVISIGRVHLREVS